MVLSVALASFSHSQSSIPLTVPDIMKFVHLAPRRAIGRIRKNGLRMGKGRWGKGVYSVPLFNLRLSTLKNPKDNIPIDEETLEDFSVPLPSTSLWRFLFTNDGFSAPPRRGRRPVAVVFEVPDDLWPIDMFFLLNIDAVRAFLSTFSRSSPRALYASDDVIESLEYSEAEGFGAFHKFEVNSATDLGKLVNLWVEAVGTAWSKHDDKVEAVIRAPIPANAIQKLVPLSQKNKKARKRRNREARRSQEEDLDQFD